MHTRRQPIFDEADCQTLDIGAAYGTLEIGRCAEPVAILQWRPRLEITVVLMRSWRLCGILDVNLPISEREVACRNHGKVCEKKIGRMTKWTDQKKQLLAWGERAVASP